MYHKFWGACTAYDAQPILIGIFRMQIYVQSTGDTFLLRLSNKNISKQFRFGSVYHK